MTMTGGKLASGALMSLSMVGAMITYLIDANFEQQDWVMPILTAIVIGWMAGWSQLGKNLGRDYLSSGLFGIGAAVVGLVFFALVYGIRSAYITHLGVQFAEAVDVVGHIVTTGVKVIETTFASTRTLAAIVVGSVSAGIIAEFLNRIWR